MPDRFNNSFRFSFEADFDEDAFHKWISTNWTHSFWYCTAYVLVVFGGRYYMKNRPKFELRAPLAVWSGLLSIFSILGMLRTMPELIHSLRTYGWDYSVCNPSFFHCDVSFWAAIFVVSKVYELGDTIFIVLRKQPLIFLHWYHHVTVLIYVWYSYTDHTAPGRWFMVMNYTVHSFMYTYYTFRAMRFQFPKWVSMIITSMQLSQMIVGLLVNIWTYMIKSNDQFCQQSYENIRYSTLMYFSYFILFGHFFYNAYMAKRKRDAAKSAGLESEKLTNGHVSQIHARNGYIQNKKSL